MIPLLHGLGLTAVLLCLVGSAGNAASAWPSRREISAERRFQLNGDDI